MATPTVRRPPPSGEALPGNRTAWLVSAGAGLHRWGRTARAAGDWRFRTVRPACGRSCRRRARGGGGGVEWLPTGAAQRGRPRREHSRWGTAQAAAARLDTASARLWQEPPAARARAAAVASCDGGTGRGIPAATLRASPRRRCRRPGSMPRGSAISKEKAALFSKGNSNFVRPGAPRPLPGLGDAIRRSVTSAIALGGWL